MGKNLVEIGELWDKHPWDVLFDLFVMAFKGEDRIALHRAALYRGARHRPDHPPAVQPGRGRVDQRHWKGPLRKTYMHPLPYAGMIHYLTHWVREKERACAWRRRSAR